MSCCDRAGDDATPWMWTVFEQCTASRCHPTETDLPTVSPAAQVAAFFRLVPQLPSTAIVTTCHQSPTMKVRGLGHLQNVINDLGRNMIDVCMLPPDLTLHLVLTLASLPLEVNDELRQFIADCPLVTLSAVLHSTITGSVISLVRCSNAMTDMLGTISSALDAASALLDDAARSCPSTLPAWLCGAAMWSRLYNSQYAIDVSHLTLDIHIAESLLHCLTLDMAASMLRGSDSEQVVEDAALSVWRHHIDALHCLSDSNTEQSSVAAVFRRCMPDILQRMQPLACLHLFIRAANSGLGQFPSRWDIARTLNWYIHCVQLFDSGHGAVMTVMTVLQQASAAICCFAAKVPQSQLWNIDQTTLDAVDPHIRIALQQFRSV